jgi:hypothetical protein
MSKEGAAILQSASEGDTGLVEWCGASNNVRDALFEKDPPANETGSLVHTSTVDAEEQDGGDGDPARTSFLTSAQAQELSARMKNLSGDERTSRALIQTLERSGVGVRLIESLRGIEVYIDALSREKMGDEDDWAQERLCLLYKDAEGRLYNLVVSVSRSFVPFCH